MAAVVQAPGQTASSPQPAASESTDKQQPSLLDVLERADLDLVAISEVDDDACRVNDARTWIVSALDAHNDGATCIGNGTAPPACVMFAGTNSAHAANLMCEQRANTRAVDVPSWATDLFSVMRATPDVYSQVTPINDAVRPSIAIAIDMELFVAIHTETGWRRTDTAVDEMMRLTGHRVLDTTPLTGTQSFGVITSSYTGGSETGTQTTKLTVLQPTERGLAQLTSLQIGQFTWLLPAEDRKKYPGAADRLDARPHVDVQLEPRVEPGVLVLAVAREDITKQFQGTCNPSPGDESEYDPRCILREMKAKAGRYKLVDGALVRGQ